MRLWKSPNLRWTYHPGSPSGMEGPAPSVDRRGGPRHQGPDQRFGQGSGMPHYDGGRPHLAHHGRHPGLAQHGQGHALDPVGGNTESGRGQGVDQLGQAFPPRRLVAVARIVGSRAPCAVRIEAQAQVDVGVGGVGRRGPVEPSGCSRGITWAPVATRGRRTAATRASRPPSSPMAIRRPSSVRGPCRRRSRSRTVLTSSGSPWRGADPAQLPERRGPQDAVHRQPGVALEVGEGLRGQGPEDAVHLSGVEAQGRQPSLQVGDVVAAEHGAAEIQEAVPQAQPGLD